MRQEAEAFEANRLMDAHLEWSTSLVARSFRRGGGSESHPAAGRQAVGSLELTRHVALVSEAGLGGGSRE